MSTDPLQTMEYKTWPKPTKPQPKVQTLERQSSNGIVSATDGCRVEPDGTCQHGHPSWLLYLGYI